MKLSDNLPLPKTELLDRINTWLQAWARHDLEGVMALMHDNVIFENWTGATISGKTRLQKSWTHWFLNHGNFSFTAEDFFVDEEEQKVLFRWHLDWPAANASLENQRETRRGVDLLHFVGGKIHKKLTYSKTQIHIDGVPIQLGANK